MFYQIDADVESRLQTGEEDVVTFFDMALTAHRMGNLILVPNRAQISALRTNPHISTLSRRTADYISLRINDYRAALAVASRRIELVDANTTANFIIRAGVCQVCFRFLSLKQLLTNSFFLGESVLDVNFASFVARSHLRSLGYPETYLHFRVVGGGGSATCHALGAEQVSPIKGLLLCDRDTAHSTPPFKHGTTASAAHAAAQRLNAIGGELGLSLTTPFFGFVATWGRAIENYVGPHVLDCYFSANNRHEERALFLAAFPAFPSLGSVDWFFWEVLNLKDKTPILTEQLAEYRLRFGAVPASVAGRLNALSDVSIPSDALRWVVDNESASRWSAGLRAASARDLGNHVYSAAVNDLSFSMLNLLAGDAGAGRS